jgi:hypothetical protein
VSTGLSWTERTAHSVTDLGPLLSFRLAGLRGRSRVLVTLAVGVIVVVTVLSGWLPGYLPEVQNAPRDEIVLLLPTGYISVLVISLVAAVASGGGRELLPRDQAVAYPVSPVTDHLGALLMAPLNIAWLLQTWSLLAATAYVVGAKPSLPLAQLPVLLWVVAATALAQVAAWFAEWVRRGPHGRVLLRLLVLLVGSGLATLIVTDTLVPALDRSPTLRITLGVLYGAAHQWLPWLRVVGGLLLLALLAVLAGAALAGAVSRRPARDEQRAESSRHAPRPAPASDLAALARVDRVAIWRSVPLRRGLAVLALLPGLVALASALEWRMLTILPGLVASGGALLFGVNSWCLDGRGALWRESLPVSSNLVFLARVLVLLEVLLLSIGLTLLLAALRAGAPTPGQAVAVLCASAVVCAQVVSASLRWSVHHPYAVDLRSARATPAPPLVMVGYSTRLAVATTVSGLLFTVASHGPWQLPVLVALPFLLASAYRLLGTSRAWADPVQRSAVITTVVG